MNKDELEKLTRELHVENQKRYDNFITELNEESDRGASIFAATFFEVKLKEILSELLRKDEVTDNMLEGANGGLNTFSARINICYVLGYITKDEKHELNMIKNIRNKFAHNFHFKFSFMEPKVSDICKSFNAKLPQGKTLRDFTSRELFVNAVINLHSLLIDRHYEVMTFSSPNFNIEKYLNDPDAYKNAGRDQQLLEEYKEQLKREGKYPY
ncbi:hypothetical protein SNE26_19570 [Mucilaginibacter sp. cycad4]|uniref:hypothetical protein n=1 Tax=Mucilaginibacter sp. cycad4 TaxID=3342096 RepID=UPI002AAA7897|nr:hypothetical protein [Mucilaginibacter gossypii]WPU98226.1 hypothetical protein SNE26_19570 [Mucilaginibacter gossypii]